MADKKQDDPVIKSGTVGPEYPEGTHPLRPLETVSDSASNLKYADNPDKPDPSTVAQIQVKD